MAQRADDMSAKTDKQECQADCNIKMRHYVPLFANEARWRL
jgi:hypothetical protein